PTERLGLGGDGHHEAAAIVSDLRCRHDQRVRRHRMRIDSSRASRRMRSATAGQGGGHEQRERVRACFAPGFMVGSHLDSTPLHWWDGRALYRDRRKAQVVLRTQTHPDGSIVIHAPRGKLWLLLLGAIGFVAAGIWIMTIREPAMVHFYHAFCGVL